MHYKNGRKAEIGDRVIGKTYNRKGVQVGVLLGISPNMNTCNCRVALCELHAFNPFAAGRTGKVHFESSLSGGVPSGVLVSPEVDYSQCDYLLHADDVLEFIESTALAKETPDLMARVLNFNKWNAPIAELPAEERPQPTS